MKWNPSGMREEWVAPRTKMDLAVVGATENEDGPT